LAPHLGNMDIPSSKQLPPFTGRKPLANLGAGFPKNGL